MGIMSDHYASPILHVAPERLLSTAYQRVGQLHELAGGDAEAIHQQLMATGLIGCDVLPAAAHLTASMLSGTHPTVKY